MVDFITPNTDMHTMADVDVFDINQYTTRIDLEKCIDDADPDVFSKVYAKGISKFGFGIIGPGAELDKKICEAAHMKNGKSFLENVENIRINAWKDAGIDIWKGITGMNVSR